MLRAALSHHHTTRPASLLQIAARNELTARKRSTLLPVDGRPPEFVQQWLDNQIPCTIENAEAARAAAKKVADWLVDAVNHAYLDPGIKTAAIDLLVTYNFTTNMIFLQVFDTFRSGIKANLDRLGGILKDLYVKRDLGTVLGQTAIDHITFDHPVAAKARGAGRAINQTDVVPCFPESFVKQKGNEIIQQCPERTYLLVTLLASIAVNDWFQSDVCEVARSVGLSEDAVRAAPHKTYIRALNKMTSKDDHRYLPEPRPAYNIDFIRDLVMCLTPEKCKVFYEALLQRFGGAGKVKNLYALPEADRTARFNLLSLMVSLVFDANTTYRDLCRLPQTKRIWDEHTGTPRGEPAGRWTKMCDVAQRYLESPHMADRPVLIIAEVQILLRDFAEIRHQMHSPHKGFRADSPESLCEDYLQGRPDLSKLEPATSLHSACFRGQLDTAEAFLAQGLDAINKIANTMSPLGIAVQNNHLDIAQLLVSNNADPNQAKTDTGSSPLFIASENGHLDIAQLLVSNNADPNQQNNNRQAPLNIAASAGHLDMVKLLVDQNADLNSKSNWGTPLREAIDDKQPEVAQYLRSKGGPYHFATPLICHAPSDKRGPSRQ